MKKMTLRLLKKPLLRLLAVTLSISFMPMLSLAESKGERYEYKESYMRDAVVKSSAAVWGWGVFFTYGDNALDSADLIRDLPYLDLSGLGITELPDLSDFTSLTNLNLSGNPISDISALEGNTQLTSLTISRTQVEKLPSIPNLEILELAGNKKLSDFSQLDIYKKLWGLDLSDTRIEALPSMPNLTALFLSNTEIIDISILENNRNLQRLRIDHTNIEDFSPLSGVDSLTYLRIGNGEKPISDELTRIIAQNRSLSELMLWGSEISSISWLANLSNLKVFALSGPSLNQQEAASILSQMTMLQELGLEHNGLNDISFLVSLPGLGGLTLTSQQIDDITPLAYLPNLRSLSFNDNHVSDLSAISNLKELIYLIAENNQIESLKPLSKLTKLQYLNLSGNQIVDISTLKNLKQLSTVMLSSNLITDLSPLSKLSLSVAEFFDNPIADEINAKKAIPSILLGTREDYERRNEPFRFEDERVQLAFQKSLQLYHPGVYQPGAETTYQMAKMCTQLDFINLGLTELPDLSAFTNLIAIWMVGNNVSDISQTEQWTLHGFSCNSSVLTDWSPLYSQTELKTLTMTDPTHQLTPEDIQFIAKNEKLERLYLAGKGYLDISPFAELKNLSLLSLDIEGSIDFSPLKLKNLEAITLTLSGATEVTGLSSPPGVKTLELICDGALDLFIASGMKKLEKLTIQGAVIHDFTPLQKNGALKELVLVRTTFASEQLSALAKVKKLNGLFILSTSMSDLGSLSELKNLQYLLLESCGIKDIVPIGKLTKLIELSLYDNEIKDIEPLQSLTKLKVLKLNNNQIDSVEPLRKLSKLTSLNILNNNIADISPILGLNLNELIVENALPNEANANALIAQNEEMEKSRRENLPDEKSLWKKLVMLKPDQISVYPANESYPDWFAEGDYSAIAVDTTKESVEFPSEVGGHPLVMLDHVVFKDSVSVVGIPASVSMIRGGFQAYQLDEPSYYLVDPENPYYTSVDGVIYTKDMETLVACPPAMLNFKIPQGVKKVQVGAFFSYTQTVSVPASVEIIESTLSDPEEFIEYYNGYRGPYDMELYNCFTRVGRFIVDPENPYFSEKNGALTNKAGDTLLLASYSLGVNKENAMIIPDGIQTIAPGAFRYHWTSLKSTYIPASLTHIDDGVGSLFDACTYIDSYIVDENNPVFESLDGNLVTKDGQAMVHKLRGN